MTSPHLLTYYFRRAIQILVPSLSTGLSNLSLHRNLMVSCEEAPHKLLDSTHTQLLLANEIKEIKDIEKQFALLHDPIEGTSYRVTNTLTKQKSLLGEIEEIEKQFLLIPDTQPNTQNPFKGIDSRVSPMNKMLTIPTQSVAISDISKHKRASPDSSGSSIEIQSIPNNPATRNKHVSFHLVSSVLLACNTSVLLLACNLHAVIHANNNTDDDPVPERFKVYDWDPARDYVIPEATKSWNLATEEYRSAALDHS